MSRPVRLIAIRYGNSVLNNEDAARKLSDGHMELSRREKQNTSFSSEWDDFVDDFPAAETYLRTDFVDRVFPTFKECVLAKEYIDETGSDASSDDGIHQILSPKTRGSPKQEPYGVVHNLNISMPKGYDGASSRAS